MRIPPDVIQQIQLHADIVEVVGDYVTLKRQGSAANLWAPCPFHNEKTPSFSVSPAKGIYKCFGCGKAGDSIKFVMEVEGVSYPEALRHLAKKYNIELPEAAPDPEEIQRQSQIDSLYIVLNFAKEFYQKNLLDTDEGRSIGVSYFKERGFRENTIKTSTWATAWPRGTPSPRPPWRKATRPTSSKRPGWSSARRAAGSTTGSANGSSSPSTTCRAA